MGHGHIGQHGARVDVDRVAAGGFDKTHTGRLEALAQVFGGPQAVAQVVFLHALLQAHGQRLQVAPGQAAVGGKALGHDQHVAHRVHPFLAAQHDEAANVDHAVLFGAHGGAVGIRKHLLHDGFDGCVLVARFAHLDEHGVLGKTADIHDEGFAMRFKQLGIGANVGHRHRLAATGVVGHGDHAKRNLVGLILEQGLHPRQVNIALERMQRGGLQALGDHQIQRLHAQVFEVGAGGVEVAVVGHHVTLFAHRREQHFFGGSALVCGHKKLHAGDVLDDFFKPVKAARTGIALIPFHDGAPLF